jgi:hypothetical protein
MMRVKEPDGQWIPIPGEPRLMKKADWTKNEKGKGYTTFTPKVLTMIEMVISTRMDP